MNELDVRLLRALLVLMAERNVSRAAERLGMSQPATSHVLARLRTVFGDPLLLRSRGGMTATNRALEIEAEVRELLARYDDLVKPGLGFEPATSVRRFSVTAPEFAEHMLMPPVMKQLRARAPGVRVDVRAPDPQRSYELLERGEVDLRIAWLLKPMPSLRSLQLFQDHMVYIADAEHPRIRGRLTLAQFLGVPHLRTYGASVSTTNRVIDEALERAGKRLEMVFYLQNFLTVPSMLVGTDAVAALPLRLARRFAQQYPLQVLEPPLKLPRIRYAAYWHERSQHDAGHAWLRQIVREAAQSISD
ncbi:MAG TPA: LysR family transcriptional regulator [Ramlibacter sp.]|uniref:LysR family transcriptional regulator n=1 Tax=Ramlibacter sp. TaxID=1917967 RepID=UPI002BB904DD|nr:LysR family transcriptional regulator [Ramlibacter sp.]HVZ45482.1 LysR family transcriptional regulator [Ramlibacter sp.]